MPPARGVETKRSALARADLVGTQRRGGRGLRLGVDAGLLALLGRNRCRGLGQRVEAAAGLREGDDVADRLGARKQRDDPGRFLYRPDWSPDGTRIAFGADDDDDGLMSILAIDVTSGEAQRLIRDGNGPAWSPDGLRLIYKPAGERQILFVADAGGNRLYQLTASDYNAWSPDWAR